MRTRSVSFVDRATSLYLPTVVRPTTESGRRRIPGVAVSSREHDRDELTDIVAPLEGDIEVWQAEYDVSNRDELRASITDAGVSEAGVYDCQQAVEDWEYVRYRL